MNTELTQPEAQTLSRVEENYRRPYYRIDSQKGHHIVEVYMPGVAKGDYSVTVQQDELVIEGRKSLTSPTGARWLHREITTESYKLRLRLNVEVDSEGIKAKSEEGVLRITLPVAKSAQPRQIKIQ